MNQLTLDLTYEQPTKNQQTNFCFIDLFAGIGGFHYGLHSVGGNCVFASELDKYARHTYHHNLINIAPDLFENEQFWGDIKLINPELIPDHDLLCGGFPCQPFSIAGQQKGFDDENRGDLIFNIIEILRVKRPSMVFLENVKNLYTHDQGRTYKAIEKLLSELGYYVHAKVLNTMEYGNLPQNRERLYIVGFQDKKQWEKFSFPAPIELTVSVRDLLDVEVGDSYYLMNKKVYPKLKDFIVRQDVVYQWRRHYARENKRGVCPTLTANMGTGGYNVPIILDDRGVRSLTPKECLRLQGFPDGFTFPIIPISHQYKQVGNSVSVPVIRRIAEQLIK